MPIAANPSAKLDTRAQNENREKGRHDQIPIRRRVRGFPAAHLTQDAVACCRGSRRPWRRTPPPRSAPEDAEDPARVLAAVPCRPTPDPAGVEFRGAPVRPRRGPRGAEQGLRGPYRRSALSLVKPRWSTGSVRLPTISDVPAIPAALQHTEASSRTDNGAVLDAKPLTPKREPAR